MKAASALHRLLRRNISAAQLTGYALANLVGLALVAIAVQFHADVNSVMQAEDSFISRDYLVISRKVSGLGSLTGGRTSFSPSDISDIEAQPWVRRTGSFTASGFNVAATVDVGSQGMSTALFLESIPSEFFDRLPQGWDYTPGSGKPVPVIVSKDYLTLYNFGFASSRNMPRVSESMIGMLPIKLSLSGAGRQQWIDARIAGFSSRLNTIAVPESFMEWANSTFADNGAPAPSRLIIEVNSPGNPAIEKYLDSHGYEAAGDNATSRRASYFLSVVTATVLAVGSVICILAFAILTLSIFLLLQKNSEKIRSLMMLGYTPRAVASTYFTLIGAINAAVLAGSVGLMLLASRLWRGPLADMGIGSASPSVAIAIATAIAAGITLLNFTAITRIIRKRFPQPRKTKQTH